MKLFNHYPEGDILLEAFEGKKKEFEKIEKLLVPVIARIKESTVLSKGELANINEMKEAQEIEELFRKAFGFKRFLLNFYETRGMGLSSPNAFTLPSSARFNLKPMRGTPVNYYYKNLVVNVQMGQELIRMMDMKPDEVVAIVLHEIGHNDDTTILTQVGALYMMVLTMMAGNLGGILFQIFNWGDIHFTTNIMQIFKDLETAIRKHVPWLDRALMGGAQILMNLYGAKKIIMGSLGSAFLNPITMIPAHIAMLSNPLQWTGYSAEKYADSFATKYGYGPALSRALAKFDDVPNLVVPKTVEKVPFVGPAMVDMAYLNYSIIGAMLDPHPQMITRVTTQLRNLKKDLNNPSLDPRLRKELEADIKEMERFIENDLTKIEPGKRRVLRTLYCKMMYEATGGRTDVRDILPEERA